MYTRDGYLVSIPRFRVRRFQRRLRVRNQNDPRGRAASRLVDTLIERAQRTPPRAAGRLPVFTTRLGRQQLQLVTRALGPMRVELLFIRTLRRP